MLSRKRFLLRTRDGLLTFVVAITAIQEDRPKAKGVPARPANMALLHWANTSSAVAALGEAARGAA